MFEEERQFFKEKTNIELSTDCWRDGSKIYLDLSCDKPIYQFKVENKKINITKDNTELFVNHQQIKIEDTIKSNSNNLDQLMQKSIIKTYSYILRHKTNKFVVSHSGGKDSTVTLYVWMKAIELIKKRKGKNINWEVCFCNTSNDTADTYKLIKSLKSELAKINICLRIINPKVGFYQWLIDIKNYFLPSTMMRNCCSTYKEGQIDKVYNKKDNITMVLGVRKYESAKRSNYDYIMDYDYRVKILGKSTLPNTWINFCPIVEWKDEDIWLFMLRENIKFNRQYKLGFNRCGCLFCPFQSDYIDLLIEKYYPQMFKRFQNIINKNYDIWNIKEHLKWSRSEWLTGKWKQGKSKIYELINMSATKQRITEVSELLGISYQMAEKYFNKKCKCGKKMNPTELAMFYKTYGRYEDIEEDNRELLCKKCFCEKEGITGKEYTQKAVDYLEGGCKLF